ncbi:MAG TPA: DUF5103 domain-containing protein [Bacteroidetes bacterium]|nr:DUF5103 domain-containing protein [Bacteroidota bacterium]
MKKILTFLFCIPFLLSYGQDENLRNYDYTYYDNIRSVKFHVDGELISLPILALGWPNALLLSFDDISGEDVRDYVYSVEHCNADWTPSNLTEIEYLDGFSDERIDNYDYSFKAKSIYTHYWVRLPNEDMAFLKSGNYLLKVYDDEDEKKLVITRRFMVADPQVDIVQRMVRPAQVSKNRTHQEIDFKVIHEGFEIRNPRQELTAVVLQNGRWDNAITGIKPFISRLEEQSFDYQDKIVFPAGKEFRSIDLRGVRYPDPRLVSMTEQNGKYEAVIETDIKRGGMAHFERFDINGNFIIENTDENGRLSIRRTDNSQSGQNGVSDAERQYQIFGRDDSQDEIHNLQSEYIDALFSLKSSGEMYGEDIYIFGGLTEWQLKPEFKMVYNPAVNAYVAKVKLKQGYYDYIYAALPEGKSEADFEVTEGDWHETENEYTILIYYRPFGGRYDQLIGMKTFTSRR